MRQSSRAAVAALAAVTANAASLADVCTVSNVQSALPSNGTILGINLIPSAVTASTANTASSGGGGPGGMKRADSTTYDYCNVTVTYTHPGKDDRVVVKYAFPSPEDFENRFYVAGGGGYSLSTTATGGLEYGAVGGATDAGYDAFTYSLDEVILDGNGTINWDNTYMFSYQALGEMTKIAKPLTRGFYGLNSEKKIYTYYEGCSDGGREGMSQIQRYGDEYDGAITGAPAFRQAQQQVNHVYSATVEHTLDYYPPPCEMDKIVNATIAACDPLDGRTDGVVSRTDLCMLEFNLTSIIGQPYYCASENYTSLGFGFSKRAEGSTTTYQPAQNGTVSAKAIEVAQTIYDGLHASNGKRGYLSWQIASEFSDAETQYDSSTASWALDITSLGGEFVTKFVQLVDLDNLSNLDGVTYDTLIEWMDIAMYRYMDSLQTTIPDLSTFEQSGGKLIHYHGESDPSVPTASSVHYWQAVREAMYPDSSYTDSLQQLADWYQLYLIPGAAHCGTNDLQPGPYPEDNMQTMINWIEKGVKPSRLNATVSSGTYAGETQMLCQWPSRPLWQNNSTFSCVHDQKSLDTWDYTFDAFKVAVY
ncbi:tannase and feruloyl esterase [Aspergillus ellipticus CBS 707.79]|uniref:Carboxylic ester hydrolase n=1 Tax=Aspergillus ellipticus CBS 707.79 TaxID=1448320 RepID=A0A319EVN5_9EURO|nr:tannase and feruloyl esterase [Aspergillus ellipticus CBS 707.79]